MIDQINRYTSPKLNKRVRYASFFQELKRGSEKLGLQLTDDALNLLLKYQDALVLWNKAYNLTAIRDPKEMLVKHLLDSLSIVKDLPHGRLLDIGTGGGMPGMIIALCQPDRECVLLDSNGKKNPLSKTVYCRFET